MVTTASAQPKNAYRRILGLPFFAGTLEECLERVHQATGLLVAPSGPGIADMERHPVYRQSLEYADTILPDSGFMVLLWNLLKRDSLKRLSCYTFLKAFVQEPLVTLPGRTFWIMPTAESWAVSMDYLNGQCGFSLSSSDCYLAPFYGVGPVEDQVLLKRLKEYRPRYIVINLGSGPQEKLGFFLKCNLDFPVSILCTGPALAFMAGLQVRIPDWADRYYLGWALRCLHDPLHFIPRYWSARRVLPLLLKYQQRSPN